MEYRNGLVLRF